jgi:hypothetical protein
MPEKVHKIAEKRRKMLLIQVTIPDNKIPGHV